MIRVLLVDDSKVHRAAIRSLLEQAGGFEIIDVAEDGEEGVAKTIALTPQVVLMDVNMPRMDGLAATERIMAERPTPILLMTGAENLERDVKLGMRGIERGAFELVAKPRDMDPRGPEARRMVELLRMIAALPAISHPRGRAKQRQAARDAASGRARKTGASSILRRARRVVAVAASTGGPRALKSFLEALPENLPAAVAIVQHIDAAFVDGLVRWLDEETALNVHVATSGIGLHEGEVLVAPAGCHMELRGEDRSVALIDGPPEGGHRPSGDRLLRSAAQAYGPRCTGVVLTGMGEDGARGLLAIREAGGVTIAQDEATSVVYGMPRVARDLGAARDVLPLPQIATAVLAAVRQP